MSTKSTFREDVARRAATKGARRSASAFPTTRFLLRAGSIPQPVDVIRALSKYGLTLKRASNVVDRLAADELVPVELHAAHARQVVSDLQALGVAAFEIKTPKVEPKQVRTLRNLSQSEFAMLYGFELDTLQNWEQGRNSPDDTVRILLKVIQDYPDVVLRVLTSSDIGSARRDQGN